LADVQTSLAVSFDRLADLPRPLEMATEHLLLGLAAARHETGLWLCQVGIDAGRLAAEIYRQYGISPDPLPLEDFEPIEREFSAAGLTPSGEAEPMLQAEMPAAPAAKLAPQEQIHLLRIIDAAANRAREGLRAVEDYARFVLDDSHLTGELKQLRHQLAEILTLLPLQHRLAARETLADVGTTLTTPSEANRPDVASVVTANFTRLQETLRSLEEFGKVLNPSVAAELKQLRYRTYTLHRAVEITSGSIERLRGARLYALVDGGSSEGDFRNLVGPLVEAGVHVIQLRDKQLADRALLRRARLLRRMTLSTKTLFVMNDRADLAALAGADGVHVGQDELTVKDARTVVGPDALIGVSTHSIEQARQAVLDGADYLGVGPTFPSGTKEFGEFPGLDLLRAVAAEIRLPAFAIGGIDPKNLADVLATGIGRIAVSGAVTRAADSAAAAAGLLAKLQE
jgi:thiamine-phosphate pyrophosphorylase